MIKARPCILIALFLVVGMGAVRCGVETPTPTQIPEPTEVASAIDESVESEVEGLVAGGAGLAVPPGFGANVYFLGLSNPTSIAVSEDGTGVCERAGWGHCSPDG